MITHALCTCQVHNRKTGKTCLYKKAGGNRRQTPQDATYYPSSLFMRQHPYLNRLRFYKKIIEKIRLENEKISWIGIDIKGTNAKITISEATEKPEIVDENEYCDIVSTKEGIITKVNAINRNSVSKRR